MGTTTKGLRYPEGTVLRNTLHTQIKNLADDMNAALVSRDARFDGLDTKTSATNADLAIRGLPISRYGGSIAAATSMPNDSANRIIYRNASLGTVPAAARTAQVSMSTTANCVANAQCWWAPQFTSDGAVTWKTMFPSVSFVNFHNNGTAALNMGFAVSSVFNVVADRGKTYGLSVDGYNDAGSSGWVACGYMQWSILFMS